MFKLSALSIREWLTIVFVLCVAGYISYNHFVGEENVALKVNNAVQSGVIKQQSKVIEIGGKLADVKEEVNLEVRYEKINVEKTHKKIADKVKQKETDINIQFESKPITAESVIERHDETSQARLDGLWEAYCSAQEDPIECVATILDTEGKPNV